jgi:hypothetical protein
VLDAAPPPVASSAPAAPPAVPGGLFSAPIGAARARGFVFAAALDVPRSAIVLSKLQGDGKTEWMRDVLTEVKWIHDADVRVFAAGDGAAVVWRGQRAGKPGRWAVVTDATGTPKGEPFAVGSEICATSEGLAWTLERAVRYRKWSEAQDAELATVPEGKSPIIACGEKKAHVLAHGDDDLSLGSVRVAEGEGTTHAFSFGDDLGVVAVQGTKIASREMRAGALGAWRAWKPTIDDTDDVHAVDGDARHVAVVYEHEEEGGCKKKDAPSLHALVLSGGEEKHVLLAPHDCAHERTNFWIAFRDQPTVAWLERLPQKDSDSPPIVGLGYAGLDGKPKRIVQRADSIVEAGCEGGTCFAVALVREPGSDGMKPGPLALLRF